MRIAHMVYGIIYRAILNDNRSYVGQTVKELSKRINEHKCQSKNNKTNRYFYNAYVSDIILKKVWS